MVAGKRNAVFHLYKAVNVIRQAKLQMTYNEFINRLRRHIQDLTHENVSWWFVEYQSSADYLLNYIAIFELKNKHVHYKQSWWALAAVFTNNQTL